MNKTIDFSNEIESLLKKAAQAATSDDALKFSQAAHNAAGAMACVNNSIQKPDTTNR